EHIDPDRDTIMSAEASEEQDGEPLRPPLGSEQVLPVGCAVEPRIHRRARSSEGATREIEVLAERADVPRRRDRARPTAAAAVVIAAARRTMRIGWPDAGRGRPCIRPAPKTSAVNATTTVKTRGSRRHRRGPWGARPTPNIGTG